MLLLYVLLNCIFCTVLNYSRLLFMLKLVVELLLMLVSVFKLTLYTEMNPNAVNLKTEIKNISNMYDNLIQQQI